MPEGVTLIDAARILPKSRLTTYKHGEETGSVALFSNIFRYTLLRDQGGWWTDTDIWDKRPGSQFAPVVDIRSFACRDYGQGEMALRGFMIFPLLAISGLLWASPITSAFHRRKADVICRR